MELHISRVQFSMWKRRWNCCVSSWRTKSRKCVQVPGLPQGNEGKFYKAVSLLCSWSRAEKLFSFLLVFILDFPTWSPLYELVYVGVWERGPLVSLVMAHRGGLWPQDEADGACGSPCLYASAGAGLGWVLTSTWHLFLLLPPYVRRISLHRSISRFPLAWGLLWEHWQWWWGGFY